MSILLWVALLSIPVAVVLLISPRRSTPPGPPPKLVSGNVHQLPPSQPWLKYAEWSKKYGPVMFFRIFRRKVVVVNTLTAANQLLSERATTYSDRPQSEMLGKLIGRSMAVFNVSSQHPRFRKYRTLLKTGLNGRALETYRELLEKERIELLVNLRDNPGNFIHHFKQSAGAVVLLLAYGWHVTGPDDYFVAQIEESFKIHAAIVRPGRWLVDTLPILRFWPSWLPGGGFKRQAKEFSRQMQTVDAEPYNWAKQQITGGDYVESFTSQHMQTSDGRVLSNEEDDTLKWAASALYGGGVETISTCMSTFVFLMVMHPDVQRRAQAEIDEVVGKERLPTVDDQPNLPYISAMIKEMLRWAPPAPMGLPHRAVQADTFSRYDIPKGATIYANIWAISHDEALYNDPHAFDPSRYLETKETIPDSRDFVFGFGHRVCPGQKFAELSVFLNITGALSVFDFTKAVDDHGVEITPTAEWSTGVVSQLKSFPCQITARSAAALNLL